MRKPNKKLGLVGTLVVGASSLLGGTGCQTTTPQPVDPMTQAVIKYDEARYSVDAAYRTAVNNAVEEAKKQNTRRLADQRENDLKPIRDATERTKKFKEDKAAFDVLCDNPLFVAPGPSTPTAPSAMPARQSLLVPDKKKDSSTEIYLGVDKRIKLLEDDKSDIPLALAAGVRHTRNGIYVDFGADSFNNTVSNNHSNLTADKTGLYLSGGMVQRVGTYELSLGAGLTSQTTNIYGQNGITSIDDTNTTVFPYVEAAISKGKKRFLRAGVRQGLGGDNRNASGVQVNVGWRK